MRKAKYTTIVKKDDGSLGVGDVCAEVIDFNEVKKMCEIGKGWIVFNKSLIKAEVVDDIIVLQRTSLENVGYVFNTELSKGVLGNLYFSHTLFLHEWQLLLSWREEGNDFDAGMWMIDKKNFEEWQKGSDKTIKIH